MVSGAHSPWGKALVLLLAGVLAGAGACSSGPRSTRFTAADLVLTTDELREALASSSFLASRDGDSPRAVLMPLEFENGSNERVSRVDQWAMMTRVLHAPGMIELLADHNVAVRMPLEREGLFERFDLSSEAAEGEIRYGTEPTHAFKMSLQSLTRAEGEGRGTERRDTYQVVVEIQELATRRVVWSALTDITRVAHRSILD